MSSFEDKNEMSFQNVNLLCSVFYCDIYNFIYFLCEIFSQKIVCQNHPLTDFQVQGVILSMWLNTHSKTIFHISQYIEI